MGSKCPVCITGTLEDWNRKARQCDSCGFQCDAEDLPHITAAMELARGLIKWKHGDDGDDYDNYKDAKKLVLGVFGGE